MVSKLIEKQKVIDCLRREELKNKGYRVSRLLWDVHSMPGSNLLTTPKPSVIRKEDLLHFVTSTFQDEVIENPDIIAEEIENNYKDFEPTTVEDGFYTGYNLAYNEIRKVIPDSVYEKVSSEYAENQWYGLSNILRGCIEELANLANINEDTVWVPGHYEEK